MANLAAANVMHRKARTAVSVLAVAMEVAMVMTLVDPIQALNFE